MAYKHKRHTPIYLLVIMLVLGAGLSASVEQKKSTPTPRPTKGATATRLATFTRTPSATPTQTRTSTATATETRIPTVTAVFTPTREATLTRTPIFTVTPGANVTPYPSAPLCAEHANNVFHALWDASKGCHYDHEHGSNPFEDETSNIFPGFELRSLLGNVEIGHSNPSSPMENTHKHGGFKWQVDTAAPTGCLTGFEGGTVAVDAYAIQFHAFGRQDIEHEARNHSSVAMLRQCKSGNPGDKGYIFVGQLQEYGQRVMPYQGFVMPYPDNFQPTYISPRGPYFTTECFGNDFSYVDITGVTRFVDCRDPGDTSSHNNTIWSSKPTQSNGSRARPETPLLFRLLFRGRDNYQRVDVADLVHPFTWRWVCGGLNYIPAGCRFNSSTMTIHEIAGTIPASWDGLAGFDTDPRVGRITAQGFVTRFGALNPNCAGVGGLDCQPLKLVNAFVGTYSSELSAFKTSNPTAENTPEREIFFCGLVVCSETTPGAVPSGWIMENN